MSFITQDGTTIPRRDLPPDLVQPDQDGLACVMACCILDLDLNDERQVITRLQYLRFRSVEITACLDDAIARARTLLAEVSEVA